MRPPRNNPTPKGAYVLLVRLPRDETIPIGRLGFSRFRAGHYAYVGSALGGLRSRLDRHLRTEKRPRWHIDYLLEKARLEDIVTCETVARVECAIADAMAMQFDSVPGFGCSDCRCRSHLFFSPGPMMPAVISAARAMGLKPAVVDVRASRR